MENPTQLLIKESEKHLRKELKNWYDKQCNKSIPYTTITGYCIRHFSTKIKVARKSHVKKQEKSAVTFKKTLLAT